jgi:hypothetical protein
MRIYKQRKTDFHQLLSINGWTIKVYTITIRRSLHPARRYARQIAKLPEWLEKSRELGFETYGTAFLIVHEGTDGVWTLINWWTGGEILQSLTFHTAFDRRTEFQPFRGEGFVACVWEMAVIVFERAMWIEHILKKARRPDFETYFAQTLTIEACSSATTATK